MNDSGATALSAGAISARIDRLPATRTIWTYIVLLGFGMFFELYDLLFTAYVAPSLVKSGVLTAGTAGLFGTTGVASFIAALFTGLFTARSSAASSPIVTGAGRSSPGRSSGIRRPTSWWRCRPTPSASTCGASFPASASASRS
jgi:hypothetical protein